MDFYSLTREMKNDIETWKDRYENAERPEDKRDRAFFSYVKAETAPFFRKIEKWNEQATVFVKNKEVKVHPQQVASTAENLELLLMHSFYLDVKRKRYMELHQSVHYVFDLLLIEFVRLNGQKN